MQLSGISISAESSADGPSKARQYIWKDVYKRQAPEGERAKEGAETAGSEPGQSAGTGEAEPREGAAADESISEPGMSTMEDPEAGKWPGASKEAVSEPGPGAVSYTHLFDPPGPVYQFRVAGAPVPFFHKDHAGGFGSGCFLHRQGESDRPGQWDRAF